jgi:hypothetical protein
MHSIKIVRTVFRTPGGTTDASLLKRLQTPEDNESGAQVDATSIVSMQVQYAAHQWKRNSRWSKKCQVTPSYSEEICPIATLTNHKPHMTWAGIEPRAKAMGDQHLTAWSMTIHSYFNLLSWTRPSLWNYVFLFSMSLLAHSGTRPLIQFRNLLSQTVGLLGRGISSSQGLYLNRRQHKHKINAYTHTPNIHVLNGIRTHDPSVKS